MATNQTGAEETSQKLRVIALLAGQPSATELWTLKALAAEPVELLIVQALRSTGRSRLERLKALRKSIGLSRLLSRILGSYLIGQWQNRLRLRELDLLFDRSSLSQWWSACGLRTIEVPSLNHDDTRSELLRLKPDLIIRVSGGVLNKKIFSVPRLGTLNIHHGVAPKIRGVWSIPWALIEDRKDWIGATVHLIDEGIDTGGVLWRGSPQLAPGDTGVTLFFRAHLEAVDALVRVVRQYVAQGTPRPIAISPSEESVYRTVPELPHWLRYTFSQRGRETETVLREAIEC